MEEVFSAEAVMLVALLLLAAGGAVLAARRLRMPTAVGLVLAGLVLGALAQIENLSWLAEFELTPGVILFVFLPTLLFESAFNIDARRLGENLLPVFILAVPVLLLSVVIVGLIVGVGVGIPIGIALIFGALISATDPVAVLSIFREVGAPKRLALLVDGESLFNDGTAFVVFAIFVGITTAGVVTGGAILDGLVQFVVGGDGWPGVRGGGGIPDGSAGGKNSQRSPGGTDDDAGAGVYRFRGGGSPAGGVGGDGDGGGGVGDGKLRPDEDISAGAGARGGNAGISGAPGEFADLRAGGAERESGIAGRGAGAGGGGGGGDSGGSGIADANGDAAGEPVHEAPGELAVSGGDVLGRPARGDGAGDGAEPGPRIRAPGAAIESHVRSGGVHAVRAGAFDQAAGECAGSAEIHGWREIRTTVGGAAGQEDGGRED